jgi:hypothetical protein
MLAVSTVLMPACTGSTLRCRNLLLTLKGCYTPILAALATAYILVLTLSGLAVLPGPPPGHLYIARVMVALGAFPVRIWV